MLERDGGDLHEVRPFTRKEVLPRLERWLAATPPAAVGSRRAEPGSAGRSRR